MASVCQVFVQSPKTADKALCVPRNGFRKISAGRGYRSNDGDTPRLSAKRFHASGALVKSGQAGG